MAGALTGLLASMLPPKPSLEVCILALDTAERAVHVSLGTLYHQEQERST